MIVNRTAVSSSSNHLVVSAEPITAALIFYSIGVWGERLQVRLEPWHLGFFVLGLIFDTWGTGMMFEFAGGMAFDIHGISGLIPYFSPMFFNMAI